MQDASAEDYPTNRTRSHAYIQIPEQMKYEVGPGNTVRNGEGKLKWRGGRGGGVL